LYGGGFPMRRNVSCLAILLHGRSVWQSIFSTRQPITQHGDDRAQTSTAINRRPCVAMQPCRAESREGGKLSLHQQIKPDAHGMSAAGRETPLVAQSLAIRCTIRPFASDAQRQIWSGVQGVQNAYAINRGAEYRGQFDSTKRRWLTFQ